MKIFDKINVLWFIAFGLLAGCSEDPKIIGTREFLLTSPVDVMVDQVTAFKPMHFKNAVRNSAWNQNCWSPEHTQENLSFDVQNCQFLWKQKFNQGSRRYAKAITNLVAHHGVLFGGDVNGHIIAFDLKKQCVSWRLNLDLPNEDIAKISGLAFLSEHELVVTTSEGLVLIVDLKSKKIVKRKKLDCPIRSAPNVSDHHIIVQSSNNNLFVMDRNLDVLWSQSETPENVVFLGSSIPVTDGHTIIAAYSDGEYKAYDFSGNELWSDFLTPHSLDYTIANILHIYASPVMSDNLAIILGNGGKLTANDIITGERVWSLGIHGLQTPVVIGKWMFVLDSDGRVFCIETHSGKVRWYSSVKMNEKKLRIKAWTAPLVAGNAVITALNDGSVLFFDVADGHLIRSIDSKAFDPIQSVLVDNVLYVLSENGFLYAFG